jgi:hypothetical protein
MIGVAVALAAGLSLPASAHGLSTERPVGMCRDPASDLWPDIGQWMCPPASAA